MFFIIALSVTSSVRDEGSMPVSSIASRTSATIVGDWSCRADRFTDIESGGVIGGMGFSPRAPLPAGWGGPRPRGGVGPPSSAGGGEKGGGGRRRGGGVGGARGPGGR